MCRTRIHEFFCTVTQTTDLLDLIQVHDLHEKMEHFSFMSIKVIRRSLGHENDSETNETTFWREKVPEQGIKNLFLEVLASSGLVESMFFRSFEMC